jgi:hypothetical protein
MNVATILAWSLGGMLAVEADPIFRWSSALAFEPIHQSLVVKVKKDKDDDDDDDEKPKKDNKPKKDQKPKNCKKARCEPGMFVLEKPNIYGACCQAGSEPLKHNTKPDEPKKCQFPGEVPPDCNCPPGTEFMGYKGCVAVKMQPLPPPAQGKYCSEDLSEEAHKAFKAGCKGFPLCKSPNTQPPFIWECCCTPKK